MLIECLVEREGPTVINKGKIKYTFMPILGAKKGEQSTSVCDISHEEHLQYFLDPKRSGQFREYDQERSLRELEVKRKKVDVKRGFSVRKYLENGYILVDGRIPKKQRFCDITGNWSDKPVSLSPFASEMEAYHALEEQIATGEIEPVEVEEEQKRRPGKKDETSKVAGVGQTHIG